MKHSSAVTLTLALLAACGGGSSTPDANTIDAPPAVGTISASWSIQDPATQAALSCDDVAGKTVTASIVPVDGFDGVVSAFTCGAGMATSQEIMVGTYDVTFDLTTSGAKSLLTQTTTINSVAVTQGQDSAVGAVSFAVDPKGSFAFTLNADATGPNCGAFDAGGGGITALRFTVKDSTGTCVDGVPLVVGAGGGASGTYTTSCTTPPDFGCIETDQSITVTDIRSGSYQLVVTGDRDGIVDCYNKTSDLAVPGNSLNLDVGDLGLALTPTLECNPNLPDAGP